MYACMYVCMRVCVRVRVRVRTCAHVQLGAGDVALTFCMWKYKTLCKRLNVGTCR